MLGFIPDHLKIKQNCKHAVKKVPFLKNMYLINKKLKKCVTKLF